MGDSLLAECKTVCDYQFVMNRWLYNFHMHIWPCDILLLNIHTVISHVIEMLKILFENHI